MNKKSKGLKILIIVGLIITIAGLILAMVGFGLGGFKSIESGPDGFYVSDFGFGVTGKEKINTGELSNVNVEKNLKSAFKESNATTGSKNDDTEKQSNGWINAVRLSFLSFFSGF
ncbi:hypothetical protein MmiAt1_04000 [Methanimicrococcus sp. At1]|uniref:Uncharacterized protein n=1 Tax=Methanimicrococcus hacksteinii TaxID=3028293 RepID=A0ABU3VN71_9EURY|nr:hypothetical protein [Methanimicrococcus sp. At1]MDV0444856.1 hypothetical protein [Methanimicrococcus sp. At1]